jgi:Trehalose-phosphatase
VPLVDVKKKEWMEAVALVFDYFRERTPRSFVEPREASIVWNYKNADIEFGRLQVPALGGSMRRLAVLVFGPQTWPFGCCTSINISFRHQAA